MTANTTAPTTAAKELNAWIEKVENAPIFDEDLVNGSAITYPLYVDSIVQVAKYFSTLIELGDQPDEGEGDIIVLIGANIIAALLLAQKMDSQLENLASKNLLNLPELPSLGEGRWNKLAEEVIKNMIIAQSDTAILVTIQTAFRTIP